MPTEFGSQSTRTAIKGADWRAWLALVWVLFFGALYTRTFIDQRGGKIRAAIAGLSSRNSPPGEARGLRSPGFSRGSRTRSIADEIPSGTTRTSATGSRVTR